MVLGYGMIYNHQDTPNTIWSFNYKEKVADVIASMPIKKGEEIFVSYGESYFRNKNKVTIENGEIRIEKDVVPTEWISWVKENVERGVGKNKIKEILLLNNFKTDSINKILGEIK